MVDSLNMDITEINTLNQEGVENLQATLRPAASWKPRPGACGTWWTASRSEPVRPRPANREAVSRRSSSPMRPRAPFHGLALSAASSAHQRAEQATHQLPAQLVGRLAHGALHRRMDSRLQNLPGHAADAGRAFLLCRRLALDLGLASALLASTS